MGYGRGEDSPSRDGDVWESPIGYRISCFVRMAKPGLHESGVVMKHVTDRRVFLFLGLAAGLGSASLTLLAVRPKSPGSGLQARSAVYGVGRVRQGAVVTAKFELVNRSLLPARITHFVESCRCGEISVSSRDVSPSESVTVECLWGTSGMRDESQTSFVVVYTDGDGPGLKRLPLVMRGEIIPEFDCSPTRIEFVEGKAATQRVSFVPRTSGGEIAVEKASCSHGAFSITLPSQREIDVSFSPDLWPTGGQLTARLKIVTNCKTERNCTIPIRVLPEADGGHALSE